MHIKKINNLSDKNDLKKIKELYERAFPPNERKPLDALLKDKSDTSDVLAFYKDEIFVGFACILTEYDISHIIYFAVDESLRNKGYGSDILQSIHKEFPDNRILVDIEVLSNKANNNKQREKRKDFYLSNGYLESPVKYDWQDESYEILVYNGSITKDDFKKFWNNVGHDNRDLADY